MHLTDCFIELIAYVSYFQKNVAARQPSYDQVKADIQRLLTGSEACVKKGLFPQDEYDQARFMVCAWADETILASNWTQKAVWQREPLQRIYYNTADAGEEAFERLNALGLHQREVREVYYLCLALGFKGRFIHPGDEVLLDQLKSSNLKLLVGSSVGLPSLERGELFPGAYPVKVAEIAQPKRRLGLDAVTITALVAPVLLFCLLYILCRLFLNGIAGNFLGA
jgi:type VI secretion system protein ImpK